jgi:hypothetical protein
MGLEKRGEIWYFTKRINGQRFRESTGFADKKSAERRAVEIEHDIRAGVHGWKSTVPSLSTWREPRGVHESLCAHPEAQVVRGGEGMAHHFTPVDLLAAALRLSRERPSRR